MNEKIELRSLGKTGIQVSPVGMGVMEFSGSKNGVFRFAFPFIPREDKNAIIQAAIAGGINWFDTAEMYGLGESERALASALKAAGKGDDEVVVATKWLPYLRTAENIPKTIDNRLQNLDGYSIDLYMIHQPHSFSPPEAEMDAMADLVEAGKIRSVGVSNFNVERMSRAHAPGCQPDALQLDGARNRNQRRPGCRQGARHHHHRLHSAGIRSADRQISPEPRIAG